MFDVDPEENQVTYWWHPESDCVFKQVGAVLYDMAFECVELTEQEYVMHLSNQMDKRE